MARHSFSLLRIPLSLSITLDVSNQRIMTHVSPLVSWISNFQAVRTLTVKKMLTIGSHNIREVQFKSQHARMNIKTKDLESHACYNLSVFYSFWQLHELTAI